MKKLYTLFFCLSMAILAMAQAPEAFNYQAVARNTSGDILSEQAVSFRISILEGSTFGAALYVETHDVTTDQFGTVSFAIGEGDLVTGSMSSIDWGSNLHFLKVELDPAGGTSFAEISTSQLLSVPYALDAAKTEQREFDALEVTEGITVGGGNEVGAIVELTGTTHESQDVIVVNFPTGWNSTNTRVLDVSIYFYVIMGDGVWWGLGYEYGGKTVGYTIHVPNAEGATGSMAIVYPEIVRNSPYRVLLMKVNDATNPLD